MPMPMPLEQIPRPFGCRLHGHLRGHPCDSSASGLDLCSSSSSMLDGRCSNAREGNNGSALFNILSKCCRLALRRSWEKLHGIFYDAVQFVNNKWELKALKSKCLIPLIWIGFKKILLLWYFSFGRKQSSILNFKVSSKENIMKYKSISFPFETLKSLIFIKIWFWYSVNSLLLYPDPVLLLLKRIRQKSEL